MDGASGNMESITLLSPSPGFQSVECDTENFDLCDTNREYLTTFYSGVTGDVVQETPSDLYLSLHEFPAKDVGGSGDCNEPWANVSQDEQLWSPQHVGWSKNIICSFKAQEVMGPDCNEPWANVSQDEQLSSPQQVWEHSSKPQQVMDPDEVKCSAFRLLSVQGLLDGDVISRDNLVLECYSRPVQWDGMASLNRDEHF